MKKQRGTDGLYHYVYKITNNINGKYYVGKHSTNYLEDGYFGSGILIKHAVKKYGHCSFIKDILSFHKTNDECLVEESLIVNKDFIADENTYNLQIGGCGSVHSIETKQKMSNTRKGQKRHIDAVNSTASKNRGQTRTIEQKQRMSDAHKGKIHSKQTIQKMTGQKRTEETKKKMSLSRTGIKCTESTKEKLRGQKRTEETKNKMRKPKTEEHKQNMRKPKIKVRCPHCGTIGGKPQMHQWHFNNCKLVQTEETNNA